MLLAIAATMMGGCVSRNVETISDEDAAAMSSTPAPAERAAPVAEPGFDVTVKVGTDVATVPDGVLYVIVRVAAAGICGSDLHPYHEREEGLDWETVKGHEFVGEVVDPGINDDDKRAAALSDTRM